MLVRIACTQGREQIVILRARRIVLSPVRWRLQNKEKKAAAPEGDHDDDDERKSEIERLGTAA